MVFSLDHWLNVRFSQTAWRVGSHIVYWLVFFCCLCYINVISFNPYRGTPLVYLNPLRITVGIVLVYYPLVYGVGLRLFNQKKWMSGLAACLVLLIIYTLLDYADERLLLRFCSSCAAAIAKTQPTYSSYLNAGMWAVVSSRLVSLGAFFAMLVYLTPAMALKAGLAYHQQYIRNLKLSRDNIQLELNFLKAQVNPHFLFNTLNNLYGLIIHGRNEQSAETVARLSDFMRYALYDSAADSVSLDKEVNLIQNYLELEKLRLNYTHVLFDFTTDGKSYFLPPLLFMPVIENAFKYNLDVAPGSEISIKLSVSNHNLDFCIRNNFDPNREKNQTGGIGLGNLQKRLAIYFPEKNTYTSQIEGTVYATHLNLSLA